MYSVYSEINMMVMLMAIFIRKRPVCFRPLYASILCIQISGALFLYHTVQYVYASTLCLRKKAT